MADSTIQVLEGILGNYGEDEVQMNGLAATYTGEAVPVSATFQGITDTLMANKWKILGGIAVLGAAVFGWRFLKARAASKATRAGVAGYGRRSRKGRKARKARR